MGRDAGYGPPSIAGPASISTPEQKQRADAAGVLIRQKDSVRETQLEAARVESDKDWAKFKYNNPSIYALIKTADYIVVPHSPAQLAAMLLAGPAFKLLGLTGKAIAKKLLSAKTIAQIEVIAKKEVGIALKELKEKALGPKAKTANVIPNSVEELVELSGKEGYDIAVHVIGWREAIATKPSSIPTRTKFAKLDKKAETTIAESIKDSGLQVRRHGTNVHDTIPTEMLALMTESELAIFRARMSKALTNKGEESGMSVINRIKQDKLDELTKAFPNEAKKHLNTVEPFVRDIAERNLPPYQGTSEVFFRVPKPKTPDVIPPSPQTISNRLADESAVPFTSNKAKVAAAKKIQEELKLVSTTAGNKTHTIMPEAIAGTNIHGQFQALQTFITQIPQSKRRDVVDAIRKHTSDFIADEKGSLNLEAFIRLGRIIKEKAPDQLPKLYKMAAKHYGYEADDIAKAIKFSASGKKAVAQNTRDEQAGKVLSNIESRLSQGKTKIGNVGGGKRKVPEDDIATAYIEKQIEPFKQTLANPRAQAAHELEAGATTDHIIDKFGPDVLEYILKQR